MNRSACDRLSGLYVSTSTNTAAGRHVQQHSRRQPTTTQCSLQQLQTAGGRPATRTQDAASPYSSLRQQQHQQQPCLQGQQQQQQQQQQRQIARAWPRPQQAVAKAISLRLKRADSTADVLGVIAEHGWRFNEVNTALAFSQLARQLRFDSSSSRAAALQHASYAQLLLLAEQQLQ
ncbi:hypothetical protein OEZ86_006037 [Tetradesmus obliquus]|nr:hypothetical protein OEZ86_006037 [Tetradesmus obliquus]